MNYTAVQFDLEGKEVAAAEEVGDVVSASSAPGEECSVLEGQGRSQAPGVLNPGQREAGMRGNSPSMEAFRVSVTRRQSPPSPCYLGAPRFLLGGPGVGP